MKIINFFHIYKNKALALLFFVLMCFSFKLLSHNEEKSKDTHNLQESKIVSESQDFLKTKHYQKNLKETGKKNILLNEIFQVVCEILENYPTKEDDFLQGAQYLRQVIDSIDNQKELENILQRVRKTQAIIEKEYTTNLNDSSQDSIIDKEILFEALSELLNKSIANFLLQALTSKLSCSVQGGSANLAYILSGNIGIHSLICQSTLGRREQYFAIDLGIGIGIGANINLTRNSSKRKSFDSQTIKVLKIPLRGDTLNKIYHASNGSIAALTGIKMYQKGGVNDKELSLGLGISYNWGGGKIFKLKNIAPNFEKLFQVLNINPNH